MPEYMDVDSFAAKVDWEGGVIDALDYGLKADDLDPADERSKPLREAWAEMERIYREAFAPAVSKVRDLLQEIEDGGDDEPEG